MVDIRNAQLASMRSVFPTACLRNSRASRPGAGEEVPYRRRLQSHERRGQGAVPVRVLAGASQRVGQARPLFQVRYAVRWALGGWGRAEARVVLCRGGQVCAWTPAGDRCITASARRGTSIARNGRGMRGRYRQALASFFAHVRLLLCAHGRRPRRSAIGRHVPSPPSGR